MHEPEPRYATVYHSGAFETVMLGVGIAVGWLLANAFRSRGAGLVEARPAGFGGEWKSGALWSNLSASRFSAAARTSDVEVGATLEEVAAAQEAVDTSAKQAYADTIDRARATNDHELGQKAALINNTANAFDGYFAARATTLVGTDISQLKGLAAQLTEEGKKIPTATNTMGEIGAYLNVFNQIIGLVK